MDVGRRLFYDLTSGDVVLDTGERQGDVIVTAPADDFAFFPELSGRTTANTGSVDYAYGDAQFANGYATATIDPPTKTLVLYPFATITSSAASIPADGTTKATITVGGLSTTDAVNFSVNGGAANAVTPANNQAVFSFATQVAGSYTIQAATVKNGKVSLVVTAQ